MRINEINSKLDITKLKWKGELQDKSYQLRVSGEGYGEVGVFLTTNNKKDWKVFYVFVDNGWKNTNLKHMMYVKMKEIAEKYGAKLHVA
jgi:hypothetical protein